MLLRAFLICTLLTLASCSAMLRRPEPLPLTEVIAMSKQGVATEQIIEKISDTQTTYQLSAVELVELHNQGVLGEVLNFIHERHLDAVRREQRMRDEMFWSDPWYGPYPYYCGPYRYRSWW